MSEYGDAGPDVDDDQGIAEATDEDELGDSFDQFPADHALASIEAEYPLDNGDVPVDSVEERTWREVPDDPSLDQRSDPAIELIEVSSDGVDGETLDGLTSDYDEGELLGESTTRDRMVPAEEAAIHIVDDSDG
jgi:hypothetical protein